MRMVGVYAPTNGMTADSSTRRRDFQQRLLKHLTAINRPSLCVIGDLNVIEPGHKPALPGFEAHDYAFCTGLLDLGLLDAYRTLQPQGSDHSWISARFGNQRLDHALISQAAGTIRECTYDHGPRQQQLSDHYGVEVLRTDQFLAGDGPLVARSLRALGHPARLASNQVGDDTVGHDVLTRLRRWDVTLTPSVTSVPGTRVNLVVCDQAGNRTWFSGLRGIVPELGGIDVQAFATAPTSTSTVTKSSKPLPASYLQPLRIPVLRSC